MESHSLFELNQYVKRVIALNFTEPLWINCEIAQISESRGNYYLELVEKDAETDEIVAKASAMIWYNNYLVIQKKLGSITKDILATGTRVLLKVQVSSHEVYGLKLSIEDVDPSYTMGQLELEKTKILERLRQENLLGKNAKNHLPNVLQKIAVLSSETAAGYADFYNQLKTNEYGYQFDIQLYNVAVQGRNVESEFLQAFNDLKFTTDIDVVVIIRGGGSKMDLACFDNYHIATVVAECPYPVISGIGHEIDDVIVDAVAHTALKTPTAVANFIIDRNLTFESKIVDTYQRIDRLVTNTINHKKLLVENAGNKLQSAKQFWIQKQKNKLEMADKIITMSAPEKILAKGFFMVEYNGEIVSDVTALSGENINLQGQNHSAEAIIKSVKNGK